ncbi:uncharacterized protein LOC130170861 isoform X4 [Seriola aureovittata]|uniref:uncharacterized protein LOC130170861 isoform X4 n=1 Tax=Seriola aureovittata TaxID=2871759 RepID=UPI0024BEB7E5|nr:uncharacterized protein LOC130170861 isoform X4 [Seriola aureovittata]
METSKVDYSTESEGKNSDASRTIPTPFCLVGMDRVGGLSFHPDGPADHIYLAEKKMQQKRRGSCLYKHALFWGKQTTITSARGAKQPPEDIPFLCRPPDPG